MERALGSRSNEWLALRGDDICATAQRYGIGGVQGGIDGEKQDEGELRSARKALGEIAAGGARGVVSLVDVRADLRLVGGWTALVLDGTCSSANANR